MCTLVLLLDLYFQMKLATLTYFRCKNPSESGVVFPNVSGDWLSKQSCAQILHLDEISTEYLVVGLRLLDGTNVQTSLTGEPRMNWEKNY